MRMTTPFPLFRLPFLPLVKVIKQMGSFQILKLSLCSKVSKFKCQLIKPAKPLHFTVFFGTEEIRMTVKFENLKPENESKENNARWRLLYVDDMMNTGEFSITHEFSYLTGNDYYIDVYNSKKYRTTSTYRISIGHFRAEFLKWIDNVIVVFNATLNVLAFDNICQPKVMKWIEERKPSLDKLALDCSFPSVTIRNILNYCHPKNEFYTRCEVFEPSGWTPSSETTKSTHVTNSLDFNDLLKLGVPIINSQCTEFTDNVLNDFLKNWTTSMRKLEYLSVVRTPNNPEINEDTVIEGLDVTRMEQTVRFERGGRTFSFTGYSILNGRGQMAVFGIDRWNKKNVAFRFLLSTFLENIQC
ncbi:hypothetical protein CRE_29688 [Caenorhabditis remanei]|uniref:Sdz-33 F-box domain-containing protein n=1 Tax=Caenorhabditis remanei TaxID=31234 RepID=E3LV74_CAERE|nr:hypothetical protein CRE_29688 [Caenorhabditis remanei]